MNRYFCVAINGSVNNCDRFIKDLRQTELDLSVDEQGYLVVSELEWDALVHLASTYQCEIESIGQAQQAA